MATDSPSRASQSPSEMEAAAGSWGRKQRDRELLGSEHRGLLSPVLWRYFSLAAGRVLREGGTDPSTMGGRHGAGWKSQASQPYLHPPGCLSFKSCVIHLPQEAYRSSLNPKDHLLQPPILVALLLRALPMYLFGKISLDSCEFTSALGLGRCSLRQAFSLCLS